MTEYEALDIFINTFNGWIVLFTSYVSIVFAFLVAATLAVDSLNRILSGVAIILFSMTSLFFIVLTSVVSLRLLDQLGEVLVLSPSPTNLAAGRAPAALTGLVVSIMVLTYFGVRFLFLLSEAA